MKDYYGQDFSYIHLKFGDMQKMYFFTDEFRAKHPNFCAEYELYWEGDAKCRFKHPLQIAQYVDMFEIPVEFYYNFTDTPSKSIEDVYAYFIREYAGITREHDGKMREDYQLGLDGEKAHGKDYAVTRVKEAR